ncbi:MAG: ATP-binding protein [Butyrivibrio sp.]|nr:ATP-binding protein [Butyrivibrio sp.]
MEKIEVEAKIENLNDVTMFVDGMLEDKECSMKAQMQIDVAVEEIFVNIASYAYGDKTGMAEICFDFDESTRTAVLTFIDQGVKYDPLAKEDPDITLSASERQIGGLGIFMVKKSMDEMLYEYKDGCNILTLKKVI